MHELAIAEAIVAQVAERCQTANRVVRVVVAIGRLSAVVPDAVRFCFPLAAEETLVAGAELEIREIPGQGRCRRCEAVMELASPWDACPCGSLDLEWIGGQELAIVEVEVA